MPGLIENNVEITFFLFYPEFIPILYNNKHIGDNVVQMNVVIPVMLSKCHHGIVSNSFSFIYCFSEFSE